MLHLCIIWKVFFSCPDPASSIPSWNCIKIKRVKNPFLFFHSTVFTVLEPSKLPFLNNSFSKKGDRLQLFVFIYGRQGKVSKPQQCNCARKKKTKHHLDKSYQLEEKTAKSQDLALPFCEATVLHNHAYRQQRINTFQTTPYLPASFRTANLFPARKE